MNGRSLNRVAAFFVDLMQRFMPDPFLFAAVLTFLTFAVAIGVAQDGAAAVLSAWADGVFRLLPFAMQMVLILVTGHALANAPSVKRVLGWIGSRPRTPGQAVVTVFAAAAAGSLLNWGFGLVVGAILARQVGARVRRADFGFLVAAAYAGFIVWESGLSSSIALISATPGSPMNFAERIGGEVLPLHATLLSPLNLIPVALTLLLMPLAFLFMQPSEEAVVPAPVEPDAARSAEPDESWTPARRLEEATSVSAGLAALVLAGLTARVAGGGPVDINAVILLMLGLGLLAHRTPMRYVHAVNEAARTVGPLLIQYPLYGGIQGMLEQSGAAALLSGFFVDLSNRESLPFWSYVASCLLNFFVPSGGGHWVVQGPIVAEAARTLHASQAATAMGVAFGDQVANMVQPFWALPLLAVAGIPVRRIMGYCVIAFAVGFVVFGAALWVFPGGA